MLAYGLASLVTIGSLLLYAIALRFPLLSRRSDLLWSGVGLFYGLVLGVCGEQFVGALLLAQAAVVALLGGLLWQLLALRVQMARSLDPIGAASLPDFSGWLAWAEVFRPVDPSLSGWQAVRQSIVGFSLLLWMQVRSGQWRLLAAGLGAIGRAAASPPAPPTTPAAAAQSAPTAPAAGSMPAAPVADPAIDPNAPKPVYVRKKYRQPEAETAVPSPSPSPVPAAPVTPPIAGGESKPVYVRKKYRQPDAEGGPPVSPPPAPPSPAPAVPAVPPPTGGESKPVYVRKKYRQPDSAEAAAPAPAPEPDRPTPPRDRPKPPSTIQLDGAKLPDEVVVDYQELPRRSPPPRRRPDRPS